MLYSKSSAFTGLGLVLSIGTNDSLPVYTTIGEIKSASAPGLKNDTVDVTNVESISGVKEFLASLSDAGEVPVSVNYIPGDAGQVAAYNAALAKTRMPFQLTLPPASIASSTNTKPGYWTFTGLVTEWGPAEIPLDKEATLPMKIKVSGLPTFTPEAA